MDDEYSPLPSEEEINQAMEEEFYLSEEEFINQKEKENENYS